MNLMKKNILWVWDSKAREAFQKLKKCFTEEPILKWFNPGLRIVVKTDVLDRALGAYLE